MRKLANAELNRLTVADFKKEPKIPLIIVLDNIRSLNNIGSVFRSSDAFLVEKIYLCGITAQPPHKDIQKTALGATESVAWQYKENTLDVVKELQAQNVQVLAVEQAESAMELQQFQPVAGKKYAMVLGNEVKGVAQNVVDVCNPVIEIPQFGTKHSLNIAVSAGIVIWDFWSKWQVLK